MDAQSESRPRLILSIGEEKRVRDSQSKSRPKSTLLSMVGAAREMDTQSKSRPRSILSTGGGGRIRDLQSKSRVKHRTRTAPSERCTLTRGNGQKQAEQRSDATNGAGEPADKAREDLSAIKMIGPSTRNWKDVLRRTEPQEALQPVR
jgi:hypothetical protein